MQTCGYQTQLLIQEEVLGEQSTRLSAGSCAWTSTPMPPDPCPEAWWSLGRPNLRARRVAQL